MFNNLIKVSHLSSQIISFRDFSECYIFQQTLRCQEDDLWMCLQAVRLTLTSCASVFERISVHLFQLFKILHFLHYICSVFLHC